MTNIRKTELKQQKLLWSPKTGIKYDKAVNGKESDAIPNSAN